MTHFLECVQTKFTEFGGLHIYIFLKMCPFQRFSLTEFQIIYETSYLIINFVTQRKEKALFLKLIHFYIPVSAPPFLC